MQDIKKPLYEYICRRPDCGCVSAIVADCGDLFTYEFLVDKAKLGLKIERIERTQLSTVMAEPTFLACPHRQQRLPLEGL